MLAGNIHRVGLAAGRLLWHLVTAVHAQVVPSREMAPWDTRRRYNPSHGAPWVQTPVSHTALQGHQHGLCKCSTVPSAFSTRDNSRRGSTLAHPRTAGKRRPKPGTPHPHSVFSRRASRRWAVLAARGGPAVDAAAAAAWRSRLDGDRTARESVRRRRGSGRHGDQRAAAPGAARPGLPRKSAVSLAAGMDPGQGGPGGVAGDRAVRAVLCQRLCPRQVSEPGRRAAGRRPAPSPGQTAFRWARPCRRPGRGQPCGQRQPAPGARRTSGRSSPVRLAGTSRRCRLHGQRGTCLHLRFSIWHTAFAVVLAHVLDI